MEMLTSQEEIMLQAVWKTGEGNLKMIIDKMPSPVPPYTTLASMMKKLEKKKLVKSRMLGNSFLYKASVQEDEYYGKYLNGVVKRKFANSYKALVNFFVEQKKISARELKEIIKVMEEKNK